MDAIVGRRRVLRSARDVPAALVDEMLDGLVARLSGTAEARRCVGLTFSFAVNDRRLASARYDVLPGGRVVMTRSDDRPASFHFTSDSITFDSVMRGQASAVLAIVTGRVRFHGSLLHVRQLLTMMPLLTASYLELREEMIERWQHRYDVRF